MKTAEQWSADGERLAMKQQHQEALKAYEEALILAPSNAELFDKKGQVLIELRRYEEGLAAHKKASMLAPDNSAFYYGIARASYCLSRLDEAIAAYDVVCKLCPQDTIAKRNRAMLLIDAERYEEALHAYADIIETSESALFVASAYHDTGRTFHQLQRYEAACEAHAQAISLSLLNTDFSDEGPALTLDEAMANYQEAVATTAHMFLCQRDFDVPPIYYYDYGLALFALQRHNEALNAYLRAWEREPFFFDFAEIAQVLHVLQRHREAQVFDQLAAKSQAKWE